MNILYYPIVDYDYVKRTMAINHCGDYVVDCLFHGFRRVFGDQCVDYQQNPVMYKSQLHQNKFVHLGFSMFGLIEDERIDREDIEQKLSAGYFDYVISPIHHTNRNNKEVITKHVQYISQFMPYNKFAVICSDEGPMSNTFLLKDNRCTFFKVEFKDEFTGKAFPIAYSIPKEKIVKEIPKKDWDFAPLMPAFLNRGHPHAKTYKYKTEESYYHDYERSYFGFTCKKGGWDCMRHYEILARGCVPYFTDIELCPVNTLFQYPKQLVYTAKTLDHVYPNYLYNPYLLFF